MRQFFTLAFLFAFIASITAQNGDKEIGITLGLINYQGDLAPNPVNAGQTNFAFGAQYRSFMSSNFALKAGLQIGKISGSDLDYNRDRGISMENQLVEVALQAEWHPLGTDRFEESGSFMRNFSPYIGLGIGMLFTNEEITLNGSNAKPEEEAGSLIVVPIDVGIHFALTPTLSATLKAGSRATFSDLLDGVSENGNADADDWYLIGGLGVLYAW